MVGLDCYGFDNNPKRRKCYEYDDHLSSTPSPSGMTFIQADIWKDEFWDELSTRGRIGDLPAPDFIHVSPECNRMSRLARVGNKEVPAPTIDISALVRRLKSLSDARPAYEPLYWTVENVPESERWMHEPVVSTLRLCGSMMARVETRSA